MKYIKKYENFKPIKINNEKPFKVKKNIDKSIRYLQKGIKSIRKRLDDPKNRDINKHSKMNKDKNDKIQKLKELTFKQAKQAAYFKNNPPVKENLKNENINLIDILESDNFKPDDIIKYMGFEENEYNVPTSYGYNSNIDEDGITFLTNFSEIEDLHNIEEGVISWIDNFIGYNNYEYYVDDDELNYLDRYLPIELLNKIKKLANLFNFNIDIDEEGSINELFNYLGLNSYLDDFKTEISYEHERAIEKTARKLINSLPFEIERKNNKNFDCEIIINYNTIIEYMKKNNIKVKTIREFIENVSELNDFSYEIEYNNYDELGDFKDLINSVESCVDNYLDNPDEVFPNIIKQDCLKAFKKNYKLAFFSYKYDEWLNYNRKRVNLFEIAKHYKNEIYDWFKSDEFKKIIKKDGDNDDINAYNEFIFGEDINKYGL